MKGMPVSTVEGPPVSRSRRSDISVSFVLRSMVAVRLIGDRVLVQDWGCCQAEVSWKEDGGDEGIRTPDLYVANVPLSQLSYTPTKNACPDARALN